MKVKKTAKIQIYLTYYTIIFIMKLCALMTYLLAGIFIFIYDGLETKYYKYESYIKIVKKIEE